MSEMVLNDDQQTFQTMFDNLPQEQQQNLILNAAINQNQQRLLAPPIANQMRKQPFAAPENFGQGLRNIGANLKNNFLQGIGAAPSYRQMAAQIDRDQYERDLRQNQTTELRAQVGRNFLTKAGAPSDMVEALSAEQVDNAITNSVGKLQRDQFGNTYVVENVSGKPIQINQLPQNLQEYFYFQSLQNQKLNADQKILSPANQQEVPPVSYEEYQRGNQLALKSGELANTDLSALGKTYRDNAILGSATSQKMDQLKDFLTIYKSQSGTGQELLNTAKGFGYNVLGIEELNPTKEQVFDAITTGIIVPEIKTLGNNPTDFDFQQIQKVFPSLKQTPEGNLILIQLKKIEAERSMIINNSWLTFSRENFNKRQTNPALFQFEWNQKLAEIQRSQEFQGNEVSTLITKAFQSLGLSAPETTTTNIVQEVSKGGIK